MNKLLHELGTQTVNEQFHRSHLTASLSLPDSDMNTHAHTLKQTAIICSEIRKNNFNRLIIRQEKCLSNYLISNTVFRILFLSVIYCLSNRPMSNLLVRKQDCPPIFFSHVHISVMLRVNVT